MRKCAALIVITLHKRSGGFLSPFTMSLAVHALTQALGTIRHWFSDYLGIIIMLSDGVNMVGIAGVREDPHCAPHPLPNEGSQAIFLGCPLVIASLTC